MARKRPETTIYLGERLQSELEQYRQSLPGPPSSSVLVREALSAYLERVTPVTGHSTARPTVPRGKSSAKPGFRQAEQRWCQDNAALLAETYRGQWVAIEGEELIAAGTDPMEVVTEARQRGIATPYVIFVDPRPAEVIRMGF